MESLTFTLVVFAAEAGDSPWAVLGVIASVVVPVLTAWGLLAANKQKRIADQHQHDLEFIKLTQQSMKDALERAEIEIGRLSTELSTTRSDLVSTRAALDGAKAEIEQLKTSVASERRQHRERVLVLVRKIRQLGGDESEFPDDA